MKGYLTSYSGMLQAVTSAPSPIRSIEIPIIQRDYAQGRQAPDVDEIRAGFLEVLLDAVAGGEPVGLDFVYGRVDHEVMRPLDGQQRLTTLFLLHWYLASAAERLDSQAPWTNFSYATRPSARLFCERLTQNALPQRVERPSAWITDQEWYLHVWKDDPTIQAMLVMLDAINDQIHQSHPDLDPSAAWARLNDQNSPAISFYLLPLEDMESDEDLYIKMNSRGKPLTLFESFKARFEQDIAYSQRSHEFAHKVDGAWSDLLWPIHGGDYIVDDEFMRYIDFLTEICEFRSEILTHGRLGPRARTVYGADHPRANDNLSLLFDAFDLWDDIRHVTNTFDTYFQVTVPGDPTYDSNKVVLFGASDTNLFEQCCHSFDSQRDRNRPFTLQQSLLLYAVLVHLRTRTEDFPRRLRILANLIAASEDEIRRSSMPALLADAEQIVISGDLDKVASFSRNQVDDEVLKQQFVIDHPDLTDAVRRLEDHPILRGTLSCFALDRETFQQRAQAFEPAFSNPERWSALTGALLATGDYQRPRPRSGAWQFGTGSRKPEWVWRYLLTDAPRKALAATRDVLMEFLDGLAGTDMPIDDYLSDLTGTWLANRESQDLLDWRYYLVRYPSMREGETGIYYGQHGQLGYSLCMLRTKQLNGYYRDPFLLQVWRQSGVGDLVEDPWFTGYESTPRWLRLVRTGVGMRNVREGYAFQPPQNEHMAGAFETITGRRDDIEWTGDEVLLRIRQVRRREHLVDCQNRVDIGAAFLKDLVDAGL